MLTLFGILTNYFSEAISTSLKVAIGFKFAARFMATTGLKVDTSSKVASTVAALPKDEWAP